MYSGFLAPGFASGSISDGVRTIAPDVIYLDGCGTTIQHWLVAGGSFLLQGNSDDRAISTSNIALGGGVTQGDFAFYTQIIDFFSQINMDDAIGPANGQWTAVVTPEINTGGLALISAALLSLGYRRKARKD
jgi:hypothetical protein